MSRSEEVEAYTRILKFQNKRYGLGIRDIVIFIVGLLILVGGSLWLSSQSRAELSSVYFILLALYLLFLIVTFFDYSFGFGLFSENQVVYSGFVVLTTVILSVFGTIFASNLYPESTVSPDLIALIALVVYLSTAFIISYFIITATPTRQGREEMIRKLTEIKNEIEKIPVGRLGSKEASQRAMKWIQFQQRDDGIWGDENPLYETAEVLRTLVQHKDGLQYSWSTIIDGKEEVRTVEQTYFLVLEALDTAAIEPNYEMLFPFQVVTEIDPERVKLEGEAFIDFEDELTTLSEWEFVKSLEEFDDRKSDISEIPIIFPMAIIFYLKDNFEVAQHSADIFSQTFDILIRRAQTRFTVQGEKETSKLLLGLMYNCLITMLRGHRRLTSDNILDEYSIQDDVDDSAMSDMDIDFDLSDMTLPDMDESNIEDDPDSPAMPSFDFDDEDTSTSSTESSQSPEGFDMSLPDTAMELEDESSEQASKIKVETSMANIRNYIRSLQSIDGSWNSSLMTTTECLSAVLDQESVESEFIKLGLHYLLALQEKNGSWQNDIVLTSKVLRVLHKINNSMSLGGF